MDYFYYSNQSFNLASILYFIAFLTYTGALVSDKKRYLKGAPYLGKAAFTVHTVALILRWIHAGLAHPPWTNLYESLVFFSWGVMGAHLFLEWRHRFKLTGMFATAVVFSAMGIASLHPAKEIEPLVPALQSNWLLFHVFMACIAYAFFLGSSFIAVFYLLKEKVSLEKMASVAAAVCLLFLAISAGKGFFTTGEIQFFKIAQMKDASGQTKEVIMNFKGQDGAPMQQFVNLKGALAVFLPLLACYLIAIVLLLKSKMQNWGRRFFYLACAIHAGLLISVAVQISQHTEMGFKSNPYRLAGFIMTFGIALFFAFLFRFKNRVVKKLPSLTELDRLSYNAILIGVPFMTLNLVSGAVWAYYAWGRYWGWDPKETWALITWFIYLIYLHMRILKGWKGTKTALISILGFFVVIFTYLGVNLVISGLHSYATG